MRSVDSLDLCTSIHVGLSMLPLDVEWAKKASETESQDIVGLLL